VIQEYAKNVGAGLLVMGAFGHSRMRDFVLGGVTKSVLSHLRQPVLLSY
jgi:nucleotide-binding universal stress UspA family protein